MSILVSEKILDQIREELCRSTDSFLLISAYCKLPLVKYFDSCIASSALEKKLVVRFRPEDITSGASDLEIYPYCKQNGWKLYFRLDLHAKTYVFDRLRCIIGSANATSSGLNIGGIGNYEMAAACELADNDLQTLDSLLVGAVEITDEIYNTMISSISDYYQHNTISFAWPKEIVDLFVSDFSILFTEDFPQCPHPADATMDDLLFLNLPGSANCEAVKTSFQKAKCYLWLKDFIKSCEPQEAYFGAISAALHTALLNEPKPYRKEVKILLSNILTWVEDLNITELQIDRPNHSQRVRFISQEVE